MKKWINEKPPGKDIYMMESQSSLTNLQLEILKLFSFNLSEDELLEIRSVLSRHFANRLSRRVGIIWEDKGLTRNDMDSWLNDENQ